MVQSGLELAVESVRRQVESLLERFLARKVGEAEQAGADAAALAEAVRDLTMRGGKRLRSLLLVAAYRAGGGAEQAPAIEASIALELLQTYLLIHDDWMDGDVLRRGGPAIHVQMRKRYGNRGDAAAILAGDLAAAYAQEALATAPFPAARVREALHEMGRTLGDVVLGQHMDIVGSGDRERMIDLKTGSYTVRLPTRLGAILAGAPEPAREALDRFAQLLGRAFQIRDDVMGAFGTPTDTGKSAGSDLRQGKRTLLVEEALDRSSPGQRALLQSVLGDVGASEEQVEEARGVLQESGARQAVEKRLGELLAQATQALDTPALALEADGVAALRELAREAIERRS